MFKLGTKALLLFLFMFPAALLSVEPEADLTDDEVVDAAVEDEDEEEEDEAVMDETQTGDSDVEDGDDVDEESQSADVASHPDADTTIMFVTGEEFPANEIVKFLVGFTNKGGEDFTVRSLEASFRYPQDYQFYIQNFTALQLDTVVQPEKQASFEYSFVPAQPMAGRPFGLVILLNYHDSQGNVYQSAVYNQTVTIVEEDEGLDGETIFMYVFLGGLVALLFFSVYQVLESRTRRRAAVKVETGTGGMNNVDISWIPQETLNAMKKVSPRASPKASPRKRVTRSAGAAETK
ncbi:translocon-associated protein subunit alpha-like [Trichomycterus rosablanca]|uniref:translocon-associated protein subunit alpha-like n=1 Tax=Trichomycterus rosablanca TaxID=2290929 RepID=UPI002F35F828